MKENSEFVYAAKKHLLPIGDDAGLVPKEDYIQFLKKRSELILREIELLTGMSTVPPEDQQHKTIGKLETRLRDLIHFTLINVHGPDYWKVAIPQDVRLEAERRIEVELRKNPDLHPRNFVNARDKLNFCNPPDYLKLIVNKSNWQYFEPIFHRKPDVEQHIAAFSEFRNAVVHNRTLTEIGRRAGELSLVWLGTVIPADDRESIELEEEQNEP